MKRLALVAAWVMVVPVLARGEGLVEGDRVAVVGDSITEQRIYSVYMEEYLLMCQPAKGVGVMQFGWGGETAGGFERRLANDFVPYKGTVATTCYGMNDGGYVAMRPEALKRYTETMGRVVGEMKGAGVRRIVVGGPGAVDEGTFVTLKTPPGVYNETLRQLGEGARGVAEKEGVGFADVHGPMMEVMGKGRAKYGPGYVMARDGVHPGPNGHLVMAYAFLKALGCDGNIGTIVVDLKAGTAEGSEGHKVLSDNAGVVEVESTRYPFCLTNDELVKVVEFFPFNQELNRMTLKVVGAGTAKVRVTWGEESKVFDAKALEGGINLAAEFVKNPFVGPFGKVEAAVRAQQEYEVSMIKGLYHKAGVTEGEKEAARKRREELAGMARGAVVPVRYEIKVEGVE